MHLFNATFISITFHIHTYIYDNVYILIHDICNKIGLGKMLMSCLEKIAHAYGMTSIVLTVQKCNKRAEKFYRKCLVSNVHICDIA